MVARLDVLPRVGGLEVSVPGPLEPIAPDAGRRALADADGVRAVRARVQERHLGLDRRPPPRGREEALGEPPAVRDARRCEHRERRSRLQLVERKPLGSLPSRGDDTRREPGIEGLRGERPERDVRYLQPMEGLAAEARLGPQQRAALCVDGELDVVRAGPEGEYHRRGTLRAGARDGAHAPCRAQRDLDVARRREPICADERDRVEEQAIRRRGRSALLLRLVRHGAPVGIPRDPPLAVTHLVAPPGLRARSILAVPRRALERESRRAHRLVRRVRARGSLAESRRIRRAGRGAQPCTGRTRPRSAARASTRRP